MSGGSSEEQLLEFLYACPLGLVECDAAGDIGMINPHAMQHLLPLAGSRDPGNLFASLEQHAPELRNLAATFTPATGRICDGHRIFVDLGRGRKSAEPKVLACTLVKLGPDRLMATLADISAQVAQEQRLRQADTWFATLLDGINDYAVLTVSPDGRIATADEAFTRQTGHAFADTIGRNLATVLGHDPCGGELHLDEQFVSAARDGWHLQESWQARPGGDRYWCQRLVVARSAGEGRATTGFSVVLRDVPRRTGGADNLRRLLTCDHLTGAANRMHFSHVLDREQAHWREHKHPLSLVLLDLDHFKTVNDRHGHPVGDVLLCRVATVCAALLPAGGVFARLGGEEFGALLPRCDGRAAETLAETLREAIAGIELPVADGVLSATASLGCATLDEADGSGDGLIALADRRLYAAKAEGRNRVYHPRPLVA